MGAVWTVRGGRQGQREQQCLEDGIIAAGYGELPALTDVQSKDDLTAIYEGSHPDASPRTRSNHVGQLWSLLHRMQEGDLVVLPLKTTGTVAVGRIAGPYRYRGDVGEGLRHTRRVEWLAKDLSRDAFDQDLLFSFGTLGTFGQVRRERAEERVLAVVEGRTVSVPTRTVDAEDGADVADAPDIEELAREQVRQHISQNFAGHDLARLVAAILEARGFTLVEASVPGPDRGVDILAGSGPMGLDAPRVVVQVKTGQAGVDEYRALRGVVENLRADHGLLVAWGGFKGTVKQEARPTFFAVRMWDADGLIDELFAVYERMSDEVRSELPLKRVWALVPTD